MLTVVHKERKKEAKKERKDYGYYTLIICKNGLDKPDHLSRTIISSRFRLSLRACSLLKQTTRRLPSESISFALKPFVTDFIPWVDKKLSAS